MKITSEAIEQDSIAPELVRKMPEPLALSDASTAVIPLRPTIPAVQLLLKYLETEGVEYVFGIPGGPLMPLYEAIHERKKMTPILAKHEEGAAFMADGYARVRRGLGVCMVTAGPGCTNAATGIASAYADGVPLMFLTAQVATSHFGRGALQECTFQNLSVVDLFKPLTKASMMLLRADKMAEMTRYLFRAALTGRPGPVHLNIPADLAKKEVPDEPISSSQYRHSNLYFDREAVKKAAQYLIRARCPAILAGGGVVSSGAYDELKRLAEKLTIPVATTVKAKGSFPENHMLSLGAFGFAGSPRAEAYLLSRQVDVLLAVGTSLGEDATNGWDQRLNPTEALLHIDIDPQSMGNNYPATVSLIGDAKTVLTELLFHIERESRWHEKAEANLEAMKEFRARIPWCVDEEKTKSTEMPLKPQRLLADLNEVMPKDAIVFTDIGQHMAWAFHYLRVERPHSFFHNLGFASMGHGVAAAIGGKLAAPERPVISIVGDAGFAMNGLEVHTAVEYNIPVIWLVFNNGGHGMVHQGESVQFGNRFHYSLYQRPLNVQKLAEAMGAASYRITKPGELQDVLRKALADRRPTVIDAIVDINEVPPVGARLKALDNYFGKNGAPDSLDPPPDRTH
jgi:acetolactate synthase I/II/III large subunit